PSNTTSNANTSQSNQAPVAPQNTTNTNTEQMPAVTPPPATNTQTAAGTGGTGGGSTPPPTTGTAIPTGTGNAITPVAGHVAGTSNGVGIQGDFATFSDATGTPPGATTISPATFGMSMGSTICVSGTASQVMTDPTTMMADYNRYYGGGVSLTLADPGGNMPGPWSRGKVTGFSFNITGMTIPAGQLRFGVDFYDGGSINHNYCKDKLVAGANTITLSTDVTDACYTPGGTALSPTATLQALKWQVATVTTAATPFNFCIENLTAITSP
ncbi:MAG TPA: hypothetical protein VG963_34335, partial [Polyangiaceae bacterium]|nr:hypothetical protein [Polyangiaceae bacterium]